MRRPRADLDRALHMSVEGVSASGIARVLNVSVSTVTRWLDKAGAHAQAFSDAHTRIDRAKEMQLDELNTHSLQRAVNAWSFNGIEVWSRLWASQRVGWRTLRTTLLFVRQIAAVCGTLIDPLLFSTDEFKYYPITIRRTFGPGCSHVQIKNRYRRDRILRSTARLIHGPQARYDFARSRCEDGTRPNTAYIERLNLHIRRCCSYLHRRTPGRARSPLRISNVLEILRVHYNFIRRHTSLRFGSVCRTPAMQLDLFPRPLTFREIMSWVPRPSLNPPRRSLLEWTTQAPREADVGHGQQSTQHAPCSTSTAATS